MGTFKKSKGFLNCQVKDNGYGHCKLNLTSKDYQSLVSVNGTLFANK